MKKVIICNCKIEGKIKKENIDELNNFLSEKDIEITILEDLCGSIIENPKAVQNIFNNKKSTLFGCEQRAMNWLLKSVGVNGQNTQIEFRNINSDYSELINSEFETGINKISETIKYTDKTPPWFPIIDFDRCTHCLKCLNFCLFGVFGTDENNKLIIKAPMNCKDMCPACSRVCPEQAIIFPKHADSKLSGEIIENAFDKNNIAEQIENDDVYNMLVNRRKKLNMRLFKREQAKKAREERNACCCKNDNGDFNC